MVKYGYNADAHSKFGLDFSAGRKDFSPIHLDDYVEPEHFMLKGISSSEISEDYKNYLNKPVYKVSLPTDKAADRYLSIVPGYECDMTQNEDGTYDIDLGSNGLEVFDVCVDEDGSGKYETKFMNAENLSKTYEHIKSKQNESLIVNTVNSKGTMTYSSEQQDDGSIKTEMLSQKSNQPKMIVHGRDDRGNEFDYLSQEQPDGTIYTEEYGE